MDLSHQKTSVFNWKLAKLVGIYHILNPSTAKYFGYNLCHVLSFFGMFSTCAVFIICLIGFYYMRNNVMLLFNLFGVLINIIFSSFKMARVLYCSKALWKCINNSGLEFMSYHRYNKKIFDHWRRHTILYSNIFFSMMVTTGSFWALSPFVSSKNNFVSIRNLDNSYSKYRMNIYNLYFIVSDTTYNTYFNLFYFIELILIVSFESFLIIFDLSLIMMCFSICCQIETIRDAIESLGHDEVNILSKYRVC